MQVENQRKKEGERKRERERKTEREREREKAREKEREREKARERERERERAKGGRERERHAMHFFFFASFTIHYSLCFLCNTCAEYQNIVSFTRLFCKRDIFSLCL